MADPTKPQPFSVYPLKQGTELQPVFSYVEAEKLIAAADFSKFVPKEMPEAGRAAKAEEFKQTALELNRLNSRLYSPEGMTAEDARRYLELPELPFAQSGRDIDFLKKDMKSFFEDPANKDIRFTAPDTRYEQEYFERLVGKVGDGSYIRKPYTTSLTFTPTEPGQEQVEFQVREPVTEYLQPYTTRKPEIALSGALGEYLNSIEALTVIDVNKGSVEMKRAVLQLKGSDDDAVSLAWTALSDVEKDDALAVYKNVTQGTMRFRAEDLYKESYVHTPSYNGSDGPRFGGDDIYEPKAREMYEEMLKAKPADFAKYLDVRLPEGSVVTSPARPDILKEYDPSSIPVVPETRGQAAETLERAQAVAKANGLPFQQEGNYTRDGFISSPAIPDGNGGLESMLTMSFSPRPSMEAVEKFTEMAGVKGYIVKGGGTDAAKFSISATELEKASPERLREAFVFMAPYLKGVPEAIKNNDPELADLLQVYNTTRAQNANDVGSFPFDPYSALKNSGNIDFVTPREESTAKPEERLATLAAWKAYYEANKDEAFMPSVGGDRKLTIDEALYETYDRPVKGSEMLSKLEAYFETLKTNEEGVLIHDPATAPLAEMKMMPTLISLLGKSSEQALSERGETTLRDNRPIVPEFAPEPPPPEKTDARKLMDWNINNLGTEGIEIALKSLKADIESGKVGKLAERDLNKDGVLDGKDVDALQTIAGNRGAIGNQVYVSMKEILQASPVKLDASGGAEASQAESAKPKSTTSGKGADEPTNQR